MVIGFLHGYCGTEATSFHPNFNNPIGEKIVLDGQSTDSQVLTSYIFY